MSSIVKALALGYAVPQVLDFITKAFPSISPKVKKARDLGYSPDQILKYLAQNSDSFEKYEGMSEQQIHKAKGEREDQFTKDLLKAGVSTLGGVAITRGIPSIVQGLFGNSSPSSNAQASQAGTLPTGIPQGGIQGGQAQPVPSGTTGLPSLSNMPKSSNQLGIPQIPPTAISPPNIPASQQPPSIDSASIIRQMELEPKINNLLNAGNDPELIGQVLSSQIKPEQKKWLDSQIKQGTAKPLPELVKDYLSKPQAPTGENAIQPQQSPIEAQPIPEAQPEQELSEKIPAKPVKGNLVSTPSGVIGDIESIKQKEALVKDDAGKLHKVKVEDLIESPLPEKDLAALHDELIGGIEKETGEQVSRNVNWAGYDPTTNTLAYLPHLGALYQYENISPERAEMLTNLLNKRKTSGENFIGAWKEGTKSPIGASMSALIQDLQKEAGGKGKEYSKKFLTLYDFLEPAKQAAKKKKAEEMKKRKKNERPTS